jgi:hypothetical protein
MTKIFAPFCCVLLLLLAFAMPVSADITVTTASAGSNYIDWTWTGTGAIDPISIIVDGNYAITNETYPANEYILSGLEPDSTHFIQVISGSSSGYNKTSTLPDSSVYGQLTANVNTWFYVLLVAVLFIIGRYLHWIFYWFGSCVALYAEALELIQYPDIVTDIWHIQFYIYLALFLLGIGLWFLQIGKKKW